MSEDDGTCLRCGLEFYNHPTPTYHYEDAQQPDGTIVRTPVLDGHLFLPRGEIGVEDDSEDLE